MNDPTCLSTYFTFCVICTCQFGISMLAKNVCRAVTGTSVMMFILNGIVIHYDSL